VRFNLLVAMALGLGVAACGQVPRPFQPEDKSEINQLLVLPDSAGVIVMPVAGLPESIAVSLAEQIADALRRENVPATTGQGNRASYLLEGETITGANGVPVARFELRSPASALITTYDVPLDASLHTGTGLDLAGIARNAAPKLAAALQPAAVTPPSDRPGLRIGEVTGAPNNGDAMLARSLDYALRRTGVKLVPDSDPDSLVVRGAVSIAPRGPKLRNIAVVWTVFAPDGEELGQVRQENDVTLEFLERAWPEMASAVADGAAEGLADLIERAPPIKR
jgi:hypothetical protein